VSCANTPAWTAVLLIDGRGDDGGQQVAQRVHNYVHLAVFKVRITIAAGGRLLSGVHCNVRESRITAFGAVERSLPSHNN
jgi:hypothetical protein